MNKRFVLLALILSAFVIYTRVQYQAQYLYSWDSVSFALSIENFNVHLHQPHPPGYILYSYTIRILNHLVNDPNKTMIYFNIAATLGACFALYKLVLMLSGSSIAGMGASALYGVNPIAAFYGSIAEIYPVEGLWVALIALLLFASRKRSTYLIWASAAMAAAGGFRPTTEVFLLPVFLACCFIPDRKILLLSFAVFLIGNLLWFVPLVIKTGGLQSYFATVQSQSARAVDAGSDQGEEGNGLKLLLRILQAISLPVFFALLAKIHRVRLKKNEWIFGVAILPSVAFFFFFPFPKNGYLLVFIPALIGFSVVLLNRLYSIRIAAAILVVACAWTWLWYVRPPQSPTLGVFALPNQSIIQAKMELSREFFETVAGIGGGGKKTFLLEARHFFPNWRTLMYYYPDDRVYLILPPKKRAYLASNHRYRFAPAPLKIVNDSTVIAVGRAKPEISMQAFRIGRFQYYFSDASQLPKAFELYSMKCRIIPQQKENNEN